MKKLLCAFLVILSTAVMADPAADLQMASQKINSAGTTLQNLYDQQGISFANQAAETQFVKSIMELQAGAKLVDKVQADTNVGNKLEGIVEETIVVQKIISAYFGPKEFFGYALKKGAVTFTVEAGASAAFERLGNRFPFIRGGATGSVVINPGQQIITQFNALKVEYYGLLVKAAHLSKTDSRVKNLANWGHDTKVIYPNDNFGTELITTQELWGLELSM